MVVGKKEIPFVEACRTESSPKADWFQSCSLSPIPRFFFPHSVGRNYASISEGGALLVLLFVFIIASVRYSIYLVNALTDFFPFPISATDLACSYLIATL